MTKKKRKKKTRAKETIGVTKASETHRPREHKEIEASALIFGKRDIPAVAFIFVLTQAIYILTLAPSVFFGDSGELIAAAYNLGIAHPPGYPLYLLLGRLFIGLFWFGDPAYRMNLLSAFFASSTAVVIYLILRVMTSRLLVAVLGAVIAAFSGAFWGQAVVAEVYTLAAFFFSIVVFLTLYWTKTGHQRWLVFLSFFAGLALTHHVAILAFYPIVFVFIVWKDATVLKNRKLLLKIAIFFLAPLIVYLYLPIRSATDPVNDWGNPETFSAMKDHIFAKLYRGKFFPHGIPGVFIQLKKFLAIVPQQFSIWLLPLSIVGLVAGLRNKPQIFGFLFSLFIVNTALASLYYIFDIESYFIPSFLMMAIFIGYSLDVLLKYIHKFERKFLDWGAVVVLSTITLLPLTTNWSQCDRSKNNLARNLGMNILNSLDKDAVLICQGDNVLYTVAYLSIVENKRPDVTIYGELQNLFSFPIYKDIKDIAEISRATVGAYERRIVFESKRPVYFSYQPDDSFPATQYGLLYRILRKGEKASDIRNPWPQYDLSDIDDPGLLDDHMSRIVVGEYYVSQAIFYWKRGEKEKSRELIDKAMSAADIYPPVLDKAGEFLTRVKQLDKAESLYKKMLEVDPFVSLCHIKLGMISILKENYGLAIRQFNEGLKDPSNGFLGTINRGIAFEGLGDGELSQSEQYMLYNKALTDYMTALRIDPVNPIIKARISRVKQKLSKLKE